MLTRDRPAVSRPEVLFIEDNGPVGESLAGYLVSEGFDVQQVGGDEALKTYRHRSATIDVLLLGAGGRDGMNELGLLHALRDLNPKVPAVVMTGAPLDQLLMSGATREDPRSFRTLSDLRTALLQSCGRPS